MKNFLRESFVAGEICHDSMVLRHAGAFGNKVVQRLETDLMFPTKQLWELACLRWRRVSQPICH